MADKKITELPELTAHGSNDEFEVVQGGDNKKSTLTKLRTFLANNFQLLSGKNATDGYAGLAGLRITFLNYINGLFPSYIQHVNTASRSYTFPDKSGTVSLTSDKSYRGSYLSFSLLTTAVPVGNPGDYAYVDFGADYPSIHYYWDNDNGGEWKNENNTVTIEVKNAEAFTLTKGKVVYTSGASGQKLDVKLADNTLEVTSSRTFGIVLYDIIAGDTGYIVPFGFIKSLNTSGLAEGAQAWLGTSGDLTDVKPLSPAHLVAIGKVINSHAVAGSLFVSVQNGYELDELHDVLITSATNNDLPTWESATSLWKNKTLYSQFTSDTTPLDTDEVFTHDTVSGFNLKTTWTNIKAFLKTYFDTAYQAILVSGTNIKTINGSSVLGTGNLSVSGGHTIQDEGTPLTQRTNLNFVGTAVTVTDGGAGLNSTIVTIAGGTPGGSTTQVQYNNAGAFGGITGATTDGTNLSVTTPTSANHAANKIYVDSKTAGADLFLYYNFY